MSATALRDRRAARVVAALLLVAIAAFGVAGCADAPEPVVHSYVIPLGTQNRLAKGERVEVWSGDLTVRVGDTLRVRNDDVVGFPFGPYRVDALSEFEIVFGAAGVYTGFCPLIGDADEYRLVVLA